jgi:hypothetical protein
MIFTCFFVILLQNAQVSKSPKYTVKAKKCLVFTSPVPKNRYDGAFSEEQKMDREDDGNCFLFSDGWQRGQYRLGIIVCHTGF